MINRLPPTGRQPNADHPDIPAVYGVSGTTEFVEWSHVEERLRAERVYWVATVDADGRPRVRPVSGVYLDGVIYLNGSPDARWFRDVGRNPQVAIHLDGPEDVVIVEGDADAPARISNGLAIRLAAVSNAKFPDFSVSPGDFGGPGQVAIRPRKVIAWTEFGRNPTRFRFE